MSGDGAGEYTTQALSCIDCYASGFYNCIDKDFSSGVCCAYGGDVTKMDECGKKFAFCTKGLQKSTYKIFTCPSDGCPNNNTHKEVNHFSFYDAQTTNITWNMFENANHCKLVYKVPPNINAKLVLDFQQVDAESVNLYMFPGRMDSDDENLIFENDLLYQVASKGTYFVPTDWLFYVQYDLSFMEGSLVIKSSVQLIEEDDDLSDFDGETVVVYDPDQKLPQDPKNCDPQFRANDEVTECINDVLLCTSTQILDDDGYCTECPSQQRANDTKTSCINDSKECTETQILSKDGFCTECSQLSRSNDDQTECVNDKESCSTTQKLSVDGYCEECPQNTRSKSNKQECYNDKESCTDIQILSKDGFCTACPANSRADQEQTTCVNDLESCSQTEILSNDGYCVACENQSRPNYEKIECVDDSASCTNIQYLSPIGKCLSCENKNRASDDKKKCINDFDQCSQIQILSETGQCMRCKDYQYANEEKTECLQDECSSTQIFSLMGKCRQCNKHFRASSSQKACINDKDNCEENEFLDEAGFCSECEEAGKKPNFCKTECISETAEEIIDEDSLCPTDGWGIDQEIIDQNTIKETSQELAIGIPADKQEDGGINLAVILVPILLFLLSLFAFLYWRRKKELEKARIADSTKNIEDDENPNKALLGRDESETGILRPDQDDPDAKDNFEKILNDRTNNDEALDDLRRQSLAKGATDEEAEKLMKELDDKMQDVDNLMLEEQEAQKQLLEDQKRRRRERRAKKNKKGDELDDELQKLKDDEEAAEAERLKALKDIDDDIEAKRRRRLKELEDAEALLAEFKKKAKDLDDELERERARQRQLLEERMRRRRQKKLDDLEKEQADEADGIDKAIDEEKRRRMLELENGDDILEEFKRKAKELDDELERDRANQKRLMEERMRKRRKKIEDDEEAARLKELEEFEKEQEKERQRKLKELEEAAKIMDEFKKLQDDMLKQLEQDRQDQIKSLEDRLAARQRKRGQEINDERQRELDEINRLAEEERQRKMLELEAADEILAEYKRKAKELEDQLEKDRQAQINALEERLAKRRKQIGEDIDKERRDGMDKIEREYEERKKRLIGMEDADAILKEFRKQEDLVKDQQERDRQEQMRRLQERMTKRRQKNNESLEKQRQEELEEINKKLEEERARKLRELEDAEKILAEFKKKAKALDESLDEERRRQILDLEARLAARRKKGDLEIDEDIKKELEQIDAELEEKSRLRRQREMEDAERILAEFKRREALVDAEMDIDRKNQADALEERLAARRARREKRSAAINGQVAFRAKMEESTVDTAAVTNALAEDIAPLFEPPKLAKEELDIVVEVDESDKAAISEKETEVSELMNGLDKQMEEEKKAKEEEEQKQQRERKRIQGILDEEEKRRLLEQLQAREREQVAELEQESASQHSALQDKLAKRREARRKAQDAAAEKKREKVLERADNAFDGILHVDEEAVEKQAQQLVGKINQDHQSVDAVKITENVLEEVHQKQIVGLQDAMFQERQKVLKKMLVDLLVQKQEALGALKQEFDPQTKFLEERIKNGLLAADTDLLEKVKEREKVAEVDLELEFEEKELAIKEKQEESRLLKEKQLKDALALRQAKEAEKAFQELQRVNEDDPGVKAYLDDLMEIQKQEMKEIQELNEKQAQEKLKAAEDAKRDRRREFNELLQKENANNQTEAQKLLKDHEIMTGNLKVQEDMDAQQRQQYLDKMRSEAKIRTKKKTLKLRDSTEENVKQISKAEFMQAMKNKLQSEEKKIAKREAILQKKREKAVADKRKNSPLIVAPVLQKGPKFIKQRQYGHQL